MDVGYGQKILEEDYDENYEPTDEEVLEYCKILGLDPHKEKDLLYIAKEGTKAPLPKDWKPIENTTTGDIYYFNFRTNETTWVHPCDEFYRNLLLEERRKKEREGAAGARRGSKKIAKVKKTQGRRAGEMTEKPPATGLAPNPLNPLGGLGGEGRASLAPLGPVRGLPPLRTPQMKAGALAPVRPPPGVAPLMGPPSAPSPLTLTQAPPLTSSHPPHVSNTLNPLQRGARGGGGGGEVRGGREGDRGREEARGGDRGGGRGGGKTMDGERKDLLGTVELGANLNISTRFEEEEEEEVTEESSSDHDREFRSKFGENLLSPKDIGMKSEEELNSSDEDVCEELKNIMNGSREDDEEEEEGERPVARLGQLQDIGLSPTSVGLPTSPLLSPPIPSSLSPLPATHAATSDRTSTAKWNRPPPQTETTTAKHGPTPSNQRGNTETTANTTNSRGLPITSSSITAPPSLRTGPSSTTAGSTNTTLGYSKPLYGSGATKDARHSKSPIANSTTTAVSGGGVFSVAEIRSGGRGQGQVGVVSREEEESANLPPSSLDRMEAVVAENLQQLERLRQTHEETVVALKKQLQREREAVEREGREAVERVRREVEERRAEEERKLRDRNLRNIAELKKKLEEEEEEEEARMVESKEDSVRRLRQKMSAEREKEEREMRERAEKSRQELAQQLEREKHEEEARLRSVASREVNEFREEVEREGEGEREEVRSQFQRQLQVFREEQEDKHSREKAEIEESHREQLEALQTQLQEEKLKVESELKKKHNMEEEREKAVKAHKEAEGALEIELTTALEAKRSELQDQHHTTLETMKRELEASLTAAKAEEEGKVERERQRLESEFKTISATMKQEHEGRVEQMKTALATAEVQCRQQTEAQQSQKLASLQSDYDKRRSELEQLQQGLEQQSQQVESERRKLLEEQAEIKATTETERQSLASLQSCRSSLERDLEQLREQSALLEARVRQLQGGERERAHKRVTDNPLLFAVNDTTSATTSDYSAVGSPPPPPSSHVAAVHRDIQAPSINTATASAPGDQRVKPLATDGGERVKVKSHDLGSEGDWSETSGSVGSMQLEELALSPSEASSSVSAVVVSKTDRSLENVTAMLEQNQRTLVQILTEEKSALSSAKTLLRLQAEGRREEGGGGRGKGKGRERERQAKAKKKRVTTTPLPLPGSEGLQSTRTSSVQSKLQKEVRALSDLEEKLRSSRQLLSSKEHELRELHSLLTETKPTTSDGDHSQPRQTLQLEPTPSSPDKHRLDKAKKKRSEKSSERASSAGSTSTGRRRRELDVEEDREGQRATERAKASSGGGRGPQRVLRLEVSETSSSGGGGGGAGRRGGGSVDRSESSGLSQSTGSSSSVTANDDVSTIDGGEEQMEERSEITRSLRRINGQLSQLMSRLVQGPPPVAPSPGLPPQLTSESVHYPPRNPLHYASPHAHTRWADPVRYPDPTDLQLQRKRDSYTNAHVGAVSGHSRFDSHVTPTGPAYPPGRRSEELIRYQTDWLRDFHRRFPGNPVSPAASPFASTAPPPPPPATQPLSASLSPYHNVPLPQLVMDGDSNIHLVHM